MAECKKNGVTCPDFYKCTQEGDVVASTGKKLQQFCFYCMATPRIKNWNYRFLDRIHAAVVSKRAWLREEQS